MNKSKILLTSIGLSSEVVSKYLKSIIVNPQSESVAIITTAAEGKENNKYSQLARNQFLDQGFVNVDFVDLETQPEKNLSLYRILYVCGGNTFKLLKFARESNLKSSIENLLARNGVYIGVSAGSIIVGPSIQIAGEISADNNEVGLEDVTGLGITNLVVLPHYSSEIESETKTFEIKYGITVERLSNSQAILIENSEKAFIE